MNQLRGLPLVLLLAWGCQVNTPDYQKEWAALVANNSVSETTFDDVKSRHPGEWDLELSMGIFQLTKGGFDSADRHLNEALRLRPLFADKEKDYVLTSGLAEVAYQQGRYQLALKLAGEAVKLSAEDALANQLIQARVHFIQGKKEEARPLFDAVWKKNPEKFSRESFLAYYSLLTEAGEWQPALDLLDRETKASGYQSGLGLRYSRVLEAKEQYSASILAAYFDLRDQRVKGQISSSALVTNLKTLGAQLKSRAIPEALWKRMLDAVSALESGQEPALPPLDRDLPFQHFFAVRALVLDKPGREQPLDELASWEPTFAGVAEFYSLYATALKKRAAGYGFSQARPFLERVILLAPASVPASAAREELGRLLDLTPAQGRKLLLPAELQKLVQGLGVTGDPKLLAPALELLELPYNPYTEVAVSFLQALCAGDGRIRDYVKAQSVQSPAKDKYQRVLGG